MIPQASPPSSDATPRTGAQAEPASFIVFSDDWGEHPSSCQHLFRHIARDHRVLWVNTIGMRAPTLTLSDLRKARTKIGKMLKGSQTAATPKTSTDSLQLRVTQPFMIPFGSIGPVRRWNRHSVTRTVLRASRELGLRDPIVVSTVPNVSDAVRHVGGSKVVYYCVDDFTQWPGLDHDLVIEMDRRMIAAADVLIATSHKLQQRLEASGKTTQLLQHGVDLDLFGRDTLPHACLNAIPHPRAGYFGLFDERSDVDLLVAVATRMPDFSFVFTGPVASDTSRLRALPNVHFTGPVPYAELPAIVAGLDMLFIPYLVNDFTDSISPLKLKEYLATGKPVTMTPMAEAARLKDHLYIAATPAEWELALRDSLHVDPVARKVRMAEVLRSDSWEKKGRLFLQWCVSEFQERPRIDRLANERKPE